MTGFLKDIAISQVDALLIDGKKYTEEQIKDLIKRYGSEMIPAKKGKKK